MVGGEKVSTGSVSGREPQFRKDKGNTIARHRECSRT